MRLELDIAGQIDLVAEALELVVPEMMRAVRAGVTRFTAESADPEIGEAARIVLTSDVSAPTFVALKEQT